MEAPPRLLPTAVRAFTLRANATPPSAGDRPPRRQRRRRYAQEALIVDIETQGPNQRFVLGVSQFFRDPHGGPAGTTRVEECLFCADDLPERDPEGFARLVSFADSYPAAVSPGYSPGLVLMSRSDWLQNRLYRYGYRHRNRCAVVGFHLGFDLGGLATHFGAGRGTFRGGWSLAFWGEYDTRGQWRDRRYHPRLLMRALDGRRTIFAWGGLDPDDQDDLGVGGQFVDLRTLTGALTDESYDLERACRAFGDDYHKADVDYETFDERLFTYALDDVRHTATLYRNAMAELARHEGIKLQAHRLYSPASVSAAYFEAMGLARPLEQFTNIPAEALGWHSTTADRATNPTPVQPRELGRAMSAFFGARAGAQLIREVVPVAVVDMVSEYPTVNANLGTWELLTAERVETRDVTDDVRIVLADPKLAAKCLSRTFWRERIGCTMVEIENPRDAVLPARAPWNPGSPEPGIGVNPFTFHGRLWYMLPDVIAATIDGTGSFAVVRAIRFVGVGRQAGLRSVRFRSGRSIDPLVDDPFVVMVEERQRVLRDSTLSDEERKRRAQSLKITNNSAAYGMLARFDRRESSTPVGLAVFGPDEDPLRRTTTAPEDPGPYCWPPIAANITAAGRLMLLLLEHKVFAGGGAFVYTDTDSMAIVATPDGGLIEAGSEQVTALSWDAVRALIVDFDGLNPYDPELVPNLWKVEHDSLTQPLYCYAVSAKRYCLFHLGEAGAPEMLWSGEDGADSEADEGLTDWSEHGLGVYLDPSADASGSVRRDPQGRRLWIREAWEWILRREFGNHPVLPDWADRYALSQFSLGRPQQLGWFAGRDEHLGRSERMRPGSFGLLAQPIGFLSGLSGSRRPAAPYERAAEQWAALPWYDRTTGHPMRVTGVDPGLEPDRMGAEHERGSVRVKTMADVIEAYPRRPEFKSLAPDGGLVTSQTRGLLRRRPIESLPAMTRLTGKEGNKLLGRSTGELAAGDPWAYQMDLGGRVDLWADLLLPVAQALGSGNVAAATGLHRRSVERALSGRTRPRERQLPRWVAGLHGLAAAKLIEGDGPLLGEALADLQRILESIPAAQIRLCGCGCAKELTARQQRWASDACRKGAARRGKRHNRRLTPSRPLPRRSTGPTG